MMHHLDVKDKFGSNQQIWINPAKPIQNSSNSQRQTVNTLVVCGTVTFLTIAE
jgi:hypothetical protein